MKFGLCNQCLRKCVCWQVSTAMLTQVNQIETTLFNLMSGNERRFVIASKRKQCSLEISEKVKTP